MNTEEYNIIRRVQQGHTKEYEWLVRKYQAAVYNVILQMTRQHETAEELAQDVFVRAFEKIGSFHFKSRFFSWIYRIAVNTAISHNKRERRYVSAEHFPEQGARQGEKIQEEKERNELLYAAIDRLKDKYRSVIVLCYFEQLSYAEIAEIVDVPEKKVKSRLYDARRLLRSVLEKSNYF